MPARRRRAARRRRRRGAARAGRRAAAASGGCRPRAGRAARCRPRRATRRADQVEEVPLDPLAREVVRDGEDEGVVVEIGAVDLAEPGRVGRLVQRFAQPGRNVVPEGVRRQLGLVLHACCPLLRRRLGVREHSSVLGAVSMRISRPVRTCEIACLQGFRPPPHSSPQLWKACRGDRAVGRLSTAFRPPQACGQPACKTVRLYCARRPAPTADFSSSHETDLSAKRTQAEAQARLPRPHGDACRPGDPQAAPRKGPQAPLGVEPPCSAGTASPARATSTPSTGTAGRSRHAS